MGDRQDAERYHWVRNAVGVLARLDRVQLRFWGRDPKRMLNGLITNDLAVLSADRAVYGAMLTPKGRIVSDLRVVLAGDEDGELLIDLPRGSLDDVLAHLRKYVPPMFARFEAAPVAMIGVYGPRASEVISDVLGTPPRPGTDAVTRGRRGGTDVIVLGTPEAGGHGFDLLIARAAADALEERVATAAVDRGGGRIDDRTLDIARVEAGTPRWGAEITDETLPAEVYEATSSLPRAVSFTKGCYTGQEVVIRIAHRGHVNRHLRGLSLPDVPSLPPKTPLYAPGVEKEVGWTTSTVNSPTFGPISLAYVRREFGPGEEVRIGAADGPRAMVVQLPFTQE